MSKEQRNGLIRILLSAALLALAWLLPTQGALRLVLFLIPYALCGYDVLWGAVKGVISGDIFGEKLLMTLATVGAICLGEYPEAVFVMIFYQTGEWFQDYAVDKSRGDVAALMDIRPDTATVIRDGAEETVPPDTVSVGEIILIKPGEKIPLDGVIVSGQTSVNTAALTGESLPRDLTEGERVLCGCVNLTGVIRVRVDSEYASSSVKRILDLIQSASERKARSERFITRFSKVYTPVVVIFAVLLAALPPLFFAQPFSDWFGRALIFLMLSCPCALVASVPLSFFGGIGGASRSGVLMKGACYLETLSKVKTVVFDKTGTLTRGVFSVTAVHPSVCSEDELIDLAAVAEANSDHPIAQSIARAHRGHIDTSRIGSVTERPGLGVDAVIDGSLIHVGNEKLMRDAGADWQPCNEAGTIIHIAKGCEYLGHIVISDEIKAGAQRAIADIKALGVTKTVMLTGDRATVGEAVGEKLGIDSVYAELMPEDKVDKVELLQITGSPLAFVGDGINDAPVLARADLGVAMGALGSDAAIEAADIVLMDDNIQKLPLAMRIARKTMRIVRQNVVMALLVKLVVLVMGAVGAASMWLAVFADVGVLILAVLNAMRALRGVKA